MKEFNINFCYCFQIENKICKEVISDIYEEKVINLLGSACEYSTYEFKSFILLNFEDMRMTSLIKVKQICFQFKI